MYLCNSTILYFDGHEQTLLSSEINITGLLAQSVEHGIDNAKVMSLSLIQTNFKDQSFCPLHYLLPIYYAVFTARY